MSEERAILEQIGRWWQQRQAQKKPALKSNLEIPDKPKKKQLTAEEVRANAERLFPKNKTNYRDYASDWDYE